MPRLPLVLVGVVAAVLLPLLAGGLLVLLEPPAFSLRGAPVPGTRSLPGGGTLTLTETPDRAAASRLAEARHDAAPIPYSKVNELRRYRTPDGREGLITPVDHYLLEVEAESGAAIEQGVEATPFLTRNHGILSALFDRHLGATVAAILGYALLCSLLFLRALSWAGRRLPSPDIAHSPGQEVRARLRAAVPAARILRDDAGELAIVSPQPGSVLRLRFDEGRAVVRAVLTSHDVRRRGASIGWFAYRSIPASGDWTQPIADMIVAAGWEWRPVLTFFRPFGG